MNAHVRSRSLAPCGGCVTFLKLCIDKRDAPLGGPRKNDHAASRAGDATRPHLLTARRSPIPWRQRRLAPRNRRAARLQQSRGRPSLCPPRRAAPPRIVRRFVGHPVEHGDRLASGWPPRFAAARVSARAPADSAASTSSTLRFSSGAGLRPGPSARRARRRCADQLALARVAGDDHVVPRPGLDPRDRAQRSVGQRCASLAGRDIEVEIAASRLSSPPGRRSPRRPAANRRDCAVRA